VGSEVKRQWKAALGVLISILLVGWVLRGADPREVWAVLRGADWLLLLLAIAIGTSGFLVRAIRWQVFLYPLSAETRIRNCFAAVCIGFGANNLLPARVGELARAWAIARLERISATGAVASLVVERFLDLVVVFLLMAVAILHPSLPTDATVAGRSVATLTTGILAIIGVLVVGLTLLVTLPRQVLTVMRLCSGLLPDRAAQALLEGSRTFLEGLAALRDLRLLALGAAWSFAFWVWTAFSFWLTMQAVGIELGFAAALLVQGIIVLGVAVPSAPGFFGTFHAAAVVALSEVYGVGQTAALAFAFGYHLGMFFPVTLLGLWYAGRMGLTIRDLGGAEKTLEQAAVREPSKVRSSPRLIEFGP
jgi:glycosyltransferase 2 family protein